ncbi:MAG TPA: hypothetical protein VMZ50_06735 [Phycisphaerae bacterium]|nr:hypothetical protein [Phycisphaerae bacterium]
MGLWRWNGCVFERASFAAAELGLDVLLCCPGPSLADVQDASLHVPGAMVLAVNTAYPRVRPDVWIGLDCPECYDPALWSTPVTKVAGSRYAEVDFAGRTLKQCPRVYFATGAPGRPYEMFQRRGSDAELLWNGNTFFMALHLAVWMGAKRICLLGCDFGGSNDYHDGRQLSEAYRRRNRRLYGSLVDELPMLRMVGSRSGVELVSCTPGSPANEYLPYLPVADALERARDNVAAGVAFEPLDAADAELCHWTAGYRDCDGVVTGCDAEQEWMLPWWWENLRRGNDYPVAFADFGMSDAAREWCRQKGTVIDCRDVRGRFARAWFCKPFAVLRAPFRRVAWIDLDCEVRGAIDPLLDPANRGAAVARDPYCPSYDRRIAYGDGAVGFAHGDSVAGDWARAVLLHHREIRGSQAALNIVLHEWRRPGTAVPLPREYHWLRLDGENPDAVIVHWTGAEGKEHIRKLMENGKCLMTNDQ